MRWSRFGILVFALLMTASCSGKQEAASGCSSRSGWIADPSAKINGTSGGVSDADRDFLCRAALDSLGTVTLARLAAGRAADPAVKSLAVKTAQDFQVVYDLVIEIGTQHVGLRPPAAIGEPYAAMRTRLASLSGSAFDRAYLDYELTNARTMTRRFQVYPSVASEVVTQRFAVDTLRLLNDHRQAIETLETQTPQ